MGFRDKSLVTIVIYTHRHENIQVGGCDVVFPS